MIANFLKTLREELLGMSLHEYKKPHKTKMIDHIALLLNKDLVLETSSFQNSVPRFLPSQPNWACYHLFIRITFIGILNQILVSQFGLL